jgi:hypothetical protein
MEEQYLMCELSQSYMNDRVAWPARFGQTRQLHGPALAVACDTISSVRSVLEIVFDDWFALCVPILIGAGFALPADEYKEYSAARICFWAAAVWVWGKALM